MKKIITLAFAILFVFASVQMQAQKTPRPHHPKGTHHKTVKKKVVKKTVVKKKGVEKKKPL